MRIRAVPFAFLLAVAVAAPRSAALGVGRAVVERYVTVCDEERRPVLGLSEEDFALRDGGIRQHVLDVRRADAPVAVAIVHVGFSGAEQSAVNDATTALGRAIKAGDPRHPVNPFHSEVSASHNAAAAVIEMASTQLQSAPTDRRVIVAFLRRPQGDGPLTDPAHLTDAMFRSRVALWTIEVGPAQTTALDKALGEAVNVGGALRKTIPSSAELVRAVSQLAPLLTSQYVVSYEWPDPVLSQFNLTIRHERGTVLTPAWTR